MVLPIHPALRVRAALRSSAPSSIRRSARPQYNLQARFASSSSSSPSSAAQQKAKEALEGAQKGLAQAAEAAKKLGGGAGEKAGKLLGCECFSYIWNSNEMALGNSEYFYNVDTALTDCLFRVEQLIVNHFCTICPSVVSF